MMSEIRMYLKCLGKDESQEILWIFLILKTFKISNLILLYVSSCFWDEDVSAISEVVFVLE